MFFRDDFFLHETGKGDKVNDKVRKNMETAAEDTQTGMHESRKPRRFSIGLRLNLHIVLCILLSSFGVLAVAYYMHCRQIEKIFFDDAESSALNVSSLIDPDKVEWLWEKINTEEFRSLHEQAVQANDPGIIEDWMRNQPSCLGGEDLSLLDDYRYMYDLLLTVEESFPYSDIYIQRDQDDVTYYLVDPNAEDPADSLLSIGTAETPIEEFADYEDNVMIPPTISRSEYGWLLTTCRPIYKDNKAVAIASVDIDMNNIVRERRLILFNSYILILVVTAAVIAASVFLVRRSAIKPLRDLQENACGFTEGETGYTKENIIKLDLRSNDEISDLYHEIRLMQEHIVDYTHDLERVTAERERIRTELDLASQIQRSALPEIGAEFSERDEFVLAASMDPARWVGGDFYDFFYLDENRLALVIADVSGKGIPAALFMMSAKNKISGRASFGGTPAEILTDVNLQLCRNNPTHMFVTVWLGILDLRTGVISACNAGHEEPAIRGADGVFRLYQDPHGFVLGGRKRSKYTDYEIKLNPGDTIFVYTDGITEAADDNQTFYEDFRMIEALNTPGLTGPDEIIAAMKKSVQSFANGAEQADDLTMLCLLYRGPDTDQKTV